MKKFLSITLILCLLLTLSTTLVSCGHECEFSTEWSKDSTSHWHACVSEKCTEIADKADHDWDEGKITTEATQEKAGVKTFTCKTCSATKTEDVEFTGMTKEQWNSAFTSSVFQNFAYTEVSSTKGSGVSVDTEVTYKFTKTSAWAKMTAAGKSEESTAPDTASANEVRNQLVDSMKALTPYASYTYDADTKTYKANKAIKIDALNASTSDITLKFADGKLVEIKYSVDFTKENINYTATSTVTLSDYGTVVIN